MYRDKRLFPYFYHIITQQNLEIKGSINLSGDKKLSFPLYFIDLVSLALLCILYISYLKEFFYGL